MYNFTKSTPQVSNLLSFARKETLVWWIPWLTRRITFSETKNWLFFSVILSHSILNNFEINFLKSFWHCATIKFILNMNKKTEIFHLCNIIDMKFAAFFNLIFFVKRKSIPKSIKVRKGNSFANFIFISLGKKKKKMIIAESFHLFHIFSSGHHLNYKWAKALLDLP